MTLCRHDLTREETLSVAATEARMPRLGEAAVLVDRFQRMVRNRSAEHLQPWLQEANASLLAPFAKGLSADKHAVLAALTEPCSNGQTEGQINRLKLLKRQMYGRAHLDLLRARVIGMGGAPGKELHRM